MQTTVSQTQFGAQFGEGRVFAPKTTVYQVSFAPKITLLVFMILILQISQLKLLKRLKLNWIDIYTLLFWKQKTNKDQ